MTVAAAKKRCSGPVKIRCRVKHSFRMLSSWPIAGVMQFVRTTRLCRRGGGWFSVVANLCVAFFVFCFCFVVVQVLKLVQYVKEGHNALLYINRCHDTGHVPSAASLQSLEHTLIRVHKASNALQVEMKNEE